VNTTTGALTSIGTITTGNSPYAVAVDPSNRFVYAAGINGTGVYGYTINGTTGALTLIVGSPFTTDVTAPDSVTVDPTGRFVMVAEACCSNRAGITVFNINPVNGKLTVVAGSPFLPPVGTSEPSWVTVDPTGRYVYVANRGSFGTGGTTTYSINARQRQIDFPGSRTSGRPRTLGHHHRCDGKLCLHDQQRQHHLRLCD
jgi:6-phosphogluconolactonase (cycloisomerase 2 family)